MGVIYLVSGNAPNEVSDLTMKDAFSAMLESVIVHCQWQDTLLASGNLLGGTYRDGYETSVGLHGSGTVNQNTTTLIDLARSRGFRVSGSWFQHPQAHRWTWNSNAGGVAKEIDHVLVDGCWRMIQKCSVFRSAQFLNTDHRLVVATLKLQLNPREWYHPS